LAFSRVLVRAKAPSPLRSAGAVQIIYFPRRAPPKIIQNNLSTFGGGGDYLLMNAPRQIRFPEIVVVFAGSLFGLVPRYNPVVRWSAALASGLARRGCACRNFAAARRDLTRQRRERPFLHRQFARDGRAFAPGHARFPLACRRFTPVVRGCVCSPHMFPAARRGFPNCFRECAQAFRGFFQAFGHLPVAVFQNPAGFGVFPAAIRENPPAVRVFPQGISYFPESFREIAAGFGARPEPVRKA